MWLLQYFAAEQPKVLEQVPGRLPADGSKRTRSLVASLPPSVRLCGPWMVAPGSGRPQGDDRSRRCALSSPRQWRGRGRPTVWPRARAVCSGVVVDDAEVEEEAEEREGGEEDAR